jgi:hypothetical protein
MCTCSLHSQCSGSVQLGRIQIQVGKNDPQKEDKSKKYRFFHGRMLFEFCVSDLYNIVSYRMRGNRGIL